MSTRVPWFTKAFKTTQLLLPELPWANALGVSCYSVVDPTQFDNSWTAQGKLWTTSTHQYTILSTCLLFKERYVKTFKIVVTTSPSADLSHLICFANDQVKFTRLHWATATSIKTLRQRGNCTCLCLKVLYPLLAFPKSKDDVFSADSSAPKP